MLLISFQMINQLTAAQAKERLSQGALLIDVREPYETVELSYSVDQLLLLPLSEFRERYQELPKNKELIIGCLSGGRSIQVCLFLRQEGYTNISNLQGGVKEWF